MLYIHIAFSIAVSIAIISLFVPHRTKEHRLEELGINHLFTKRKDNKMKNFFLNNLYGLIILGIVLLIIFLSIFAKTFVLMRDATTPIEGMIGYVGSFGSIILTLVITMFISGRVLDKLGK